MLLRERERERLCVGWDIFLFVILSSCPNEKSVSQKSIRALVAQLKSVKEKRRERLGTLVSCTVAQLSSWRFFSARNRFKSRFHCFCFLCFCYFICGVFWSDFLASSFEILQMDGIAWHIVRPAGTWTLWISLIWIFSPLLSFLFIYLFLFV